MSYYECDGESLYEKAMELFVEAGHIATSVPLFINHTPEQFFYIDCKSNAPLSSAQRNLFGLFDNISCLFQCNSCSFFSINLLCLKNDRSQLAYDVHSMLHPFVGSEGTVCVFECEDEILLSFMGFGLNCVLSDWYPIEDDYEELAYRADIGNLSLSSDYEYFHDLVGMLARDYYFKPEPHVSELLPVDTFMNAEDDKVDREELNRIIDYEITKPQREYGEDYVPYDNSEINRDSLDLDIDLLLLDLPDDENDNPFGEETDRVEDDSEDGDEDLDEYEFEDVDPEIFRDPLLMVKWLKRKKDTEEKSTERDRKDV